MELLTFLVRIFSMLSTSFGILWKMGIFFGYEIPKRTIKKGISIQRAILGMPFRCARRIYGFVRKFLDSTPIKDKTSVSTLPEATESQTVKVLANDGPELVAEIRKLTTASMRAISNAELSRYQLKTFKETLNKWIIENEAKGAEICQIATEEKRMIKVIAVAVKHLKSLKAKRDKLERIHAEGVKKLLTSGSASAIKILDSRKVLEDFRSKEISQNKSYVYKSMSKDSEASLLCFSSKTPGASGLDSSKKCDQIVLRNNMELLQHGIEMVRQENAVLKHRLAATNEKLELVLDSSSNLVEELIKLGCQFNQVSALNKEMADLQIQLDKGREMLNSVQADRDEMRAKLQVLEGMIKEEEDYLAFESGLFESSEFAGDESQFREHLSR